MYLLTMIKIGNALHISICLTRSDLDAHIQHILEHMMTDMLHKNAGDALNLAREFTTLT